MDKLDPSTVYKEYIYAIFCVYFYNDTSEMKHTAMFFQKDYFWSCRLQWLLLYSLPLIGNYIFVNNVMRNVLLVGKYLFYSISKETLIHFTAISSKMATAPWLWFVFCKMIYLSSHGSTCSYNCSVILWRIRNEKKVICCFQHNVWHSDRKVDVSLKANK